MFWPVFTPPCDARSSGIVHSRIVIDNRKFSHRGCAIAKTCLGEAEEVASKGEGRAELWMWPVPDVPLLQA